MSPLSPPTLPASNQIVVVPLHPLTQLDAINLVKGIRSSPSTSKSPSHTSPSQPPPPPSSAQQDLRWTIRNRYYTAEVEFVVCDAPEELIKETSAEEGEEEEVPPAVVVLAPASASPSPSTAETLSLISSRTPEWDVALLISLPSPSTSPSTSCSTPEEAAWDTLSLSHGFEWVDSSQSSQSSHFPSSSSAPSSSDSPAQPPLARLTEALQAHLWAGLSRLPPPPPAAPCGLFSRPRRTSSSDDDEDETYLEGGEGGGGGGLGAPPPLPTPRPYVPPKVKFPATFLPSIPRGGGEENIAPAPAPALPETAFEDDFSPFVSAPPVASSSADSSTRGLGDLLASFGGDEEGEDEDADEHDELDFPGLGFSDFSGRGGAAAGGQGEGEGDLPEIESFEALFARLSTMQQQQQQQQQSSLPPRPAGGTRQEVEEETEETEQQRAERRKAAERLVREVFGAYGVGVSDSEEEEEEE